MSISDINRSQAKVFVWLMLFLSASPSLIKAQKYYFDNYKEEQKLSSSKVYALLQDSKDFIWLGTETGVSRFDGTRFENFTTQDGLSNYGVRRLFEDSRGNIWFGHNNGGISRFNGKFFEQASFDSITIVGDISSITERVEGEIWFTSSSDGAIVCDLPADEIKNIRAEQYKGLEGLSDQILGTYQNRAGDLFCITEVGVRRFVPEEKKFEIYRMPHLTTYFAITSMLEDRSGSIWFGTHHGGLYKYVMSESRMEYYDLIKRGIRSNFVSCLTEDSKGRIWIGTWGGGIGMFEGDSLRIFDSRNGLIPTNIQSIIEDVEGNILIADQSNGLTIFKGDAFVTIDEPEILPDPNVYAIHEDNTGAIWFGTDEGISRFFPDSERPPVIYNRADEFEKLKIRFFREDNKGNIWIGTDGGGVRMYNISTSRFEDNVTLNNEVLGRYSIVRAMETDNQNNLWIGTDDGLAYWNYKTKTGNRITVMDSITVTNITALYCDRSGKLWIGTQATDEKTGLFRLDPVKMEFSAIEVFRNIIPTAIIMDNEGVLWIGTAQGLIIFENDSITSIIKEEDGLLSNTIQLVACGTNGWIYIGTNMGLNRYFPENKSIFAYTNKNGFPGMETRPNAVLTSRNGDIWFGTANGVTRLTPSKLTIGGIEPLTHIKEMRDYFGYREMSEGLKCKYKDNDFIFDYYSICLTNPEVVEYKIKLEGYDEDWRSVADQTRAYYPKLQPGKYTFMVTARNSEGKWNSQPVSYSFMIRPPFWRSWWFILSSIFVAIIGVVVYIKIREKNLIKEKMILESKVKERTAEVVQKSMEIEEKNRDITASIRYAERIQRAMLPPEDIFRDTFVLFMPKDIVSGDFYWMYDNGDSHFIAAVDCTGHGVPGAFMSIIGHNSLNKVVREYGITRPSAIMDQLNIEVTKALLQRDEKAIADGMDLALIAFNRKKFTVEYSGAFNPLYVVRKGELFVYRGDRFPIGMTKMDVKKKFSNRQVDIQPGDMLYICSDGYADQFGSASGKKFKTGNVKKLLTEIWHLPVDEQRGRLKQVLLAWKGDLAQVDDILFIGTRIPEN